MSSHIIEHELTFQPSGVTVAVYQTVKTLRGASSEEPADFAVTKTEMFVNHQPVGRPYKYVELLDYVLGHGGCR